VLSSAFRRVLDKTLTRTKTEDLIQERCQEQHCTFRWLLFMHNSPG